MKGIAETYLECSVKNVVITVPAYFNHSQREATKNAGVIAGLNVMRIMDEPTAAALAYGFHKITKSADEHNVLVVDFGGGTFDVSLLTIGYGNFVVRATAGDTHLGGEDFNDSLVDHCVREFKKKFQEDITGNARAMSMLRTACERAKVMLSSSGREIITLPCLHNNKDFSTRISKAKFEELNNDLFMRCMDSIKKCLSDVKLDKTRVDAVLLIGGSTRIPKLQKLLQDFFEGKRLSMGMNADEAVAYGAAIQAAILNGNSDNQLQNLVLVDVTPLSLGIKERSLTKIVVPRNTPIPTKIERIATTVVDNQTSVKIAIYEGESAETKYNNLLGTFLLGGIHLAPRGVPIIDLCYDIDANGILHVSAQDRSSGSKNDIVVSKLNQDLTEEEIIKMVEQAARYKVEDEEDKARISLEDYIDKMKGIAQDPDLPASYKRKMEEAAQKAEAWLKTNHYGQIDEIRQRQSELESFIETLMKQKRGGIPYDSERPVGNTYSVWNAPSLLRIFGVVPASANHGFKTRRFNSESARVDSDSAANDPIFGELERIWVERLEITINGGVLPWREVKEYGKTLDEVAIVEKSPQEAGKSTMATPYEGI
ncbi:hypothetical protein LUZ63_016610 [Rhynchospora breviuscula]|uniref:Heat shock protein 70 n=1 Tax=Rhynchospora breviuscula TaxID=2022672 RepID=A0A9Q0C0K5_9POAL|nr:hypothetical protein LUZ63_016610 [Rhynchospora breviuscula]